jgi:uncharacterized protein (TIGR02996 family)
VSPKPTRQVLEEALAADPDDRAAAAAYADLLLEEGDPRGELIEVQLALDEPGLPDAERDRLSAREDELIEDHAEDWLGSLAEELLDPDDDEADGRPWSGAFDGRRFRLRYGWLDGVQIPQLTRDLAGWLAEEPAARLLRELVVEETSELNMPESIWPLLEAPFLPTLRSLRLGEAVDCDELGGYRGYSCLVNGAGVAELVRRAPRLEELRLFAHTVDTDTLFRLPMPRLRLLQVYHERHYPLAALAENPSLANLETLLLHPANRRREGSFWTLLLRPWRAPSEVYLHLDAAQALLRSRHLNRLTHIQLRGSDLGDRGCEELARSGWLRRLRTLDLRFGCVGDDGARALAASPDLKNLHRLDLRNNWLTDDQQAVGSDEFLYSGDIE